MVLDLGKGGLFSPSGVEQDTGRLPERWGQDGSTIINISKSAITSGSAYTVTSGKRLFVSFLGVEDTGTGSGKVTDTSGGADKFAWKFGAAGTIVVSFPTPLYFDTEVYYHEGTSSSGTLVLIGWEEDL